MTDPSHAKSRDARPHRGALVAVALGMLAVNLDFFAMQTALPAMARDLHSTPTELQWVISVYLLAPACFMITGGRLADIYGRKRLFLIGSAVFGFTSLIGGMAPGPGLVIAMRLVQGLGGALVFPVGLAIVSNAVPPRDVKRTVAIVLGIAAAGQALGPLFGGAITDIASWRWVLWTNVPMSVAIVGLTLHGVSESRDPDRPSTIDWAGLALVSGSAGLLVFAADRANDFGWSSPRIALLIGCGLVGLAAFVSVERRVHEPLLDISLLRSPGVPLVISSGAVANLVALAMIFLATTRLQEIRGLSPLAAGTAFLAFSIPYAAGNRLAGAAGRVRPSLVMSAALATAGVGTALLGSLDDPPAFLVFAAVAGIGFGCAWAFPSAFAQASAPPARAGTIGGVVLTVLIGCGAFGVAIASSAIDPITAATVDRALIGFGTAALGAAALTFIVGVRTPRQR